MQPENLLGQGGCADSSLALFGQVQRPGEKTQVALIFYGDQGVGKGILFEWVGQKIFGDQLYVQTDTMRSILGDYSTLMKNKKLCQYDEVSIADTRPVVRPPPAVPAPLASSNVHFCAFLWRRRRSTG